MGIHELLNIPGNFAAQSGEPEIGAVAAIGRNRVLGRENKLLWHIPDDLKRFKQLTEGHPIILGRKTYESILGYLGKPLPNRLNIVVTRDPAGMIELRSQSSDVVAVGSVEEAITRAKAENSDKISIGGGAQIYKAALPYTDKLYLTIIEAEEEGDAYFPEYEAEFIKETFRENREWNGLKYSWVDLAR